MNPISHLPRWAQAPTKKLLEKAEIPGTKTRPLDQHGFDESYKLAAGVVSLAANDEVPGEDQAMGQPGVVRRNGVSVYFEGDSSNSKGQIEAVVTGTRRGVEYATYVQANADSFTTLQMVNEDGSIDLQGGVVHLKSGNIEGYLIAGQLSTDKT